MSGRDWEAVAMDALVVIVNISILLGFVLCTVTTIARRNWFGSLVMGAMTVGFVAYLALSKGGER